MVVKRLFDRSRGGMFGEMLANSSIRGEQSDKPIKPITKHTSFAQLHHFRVKNHSPKRGLLLGLVHDELGRFLLRLTFGTEADAKKWGKHPSARR